MLKWNAFVYSFDIILNRDHVACVCDRLYLFLMQFLAGRFRFCNYLKVEIGETLKIGNFHWNESKGSL